MNSSMRRCATLRSVGTDGLDVAALAEHDLGLGQIEVDRAALLAPRAQDLVEREHAAREYVAEVR